MKKRNKYWKYVIYLVCGIMLVVPFSKTFIQHDEVKGEWVTDCLLNSFEYSIVLIPIIFLLVIIPRIENTVLKNVSISILYLLSGIVFLFAVQSIILPIQDFVPQWGILILIILFPIVVIDSIILCKKINTTKAN